MVEGALTNRTFYGDRNILELQCPGQQPPMGHM